VVPVIIGAIGTISKLLRKYLSNSRESRTSRIYKKKMGPAQILGKVHKTGGVRIS